MPNSSPPNGCLASGTLVHTEHGAMLIGHVREGMRVLSRPPNDLRQEYRPVVNCHERYDQPVWALRFSVAGQEFTTTVFVSPYQLFWVEEVFTADGLHRLRDIKKWLPAERLEPGSVVRLADGEKAAVFLSGLVRATQHAGVGFAEDGRCVYGIPGVAVDFRAPQVVRLVGELSIQVSNEYEAGVLRLGGPCLIAAYSLEVEEFHTLYIGGGGIGIGTEVGHGAEAGVWTWDASTCSGGIEGD